jgi:ribonuclease T1
MTIVRNQTGLLAYLVIAFWIAGCAPPAGLESAAEPVKEASPEIPEKVEKVLHYIDEHHEAPAGFEGGREFHNAEGLLPKRDAHGRAITYHEWDVNRKVAGVNRGPERLVTGSDGSAFYTADHYRTYIQIR